MLAEQMNTLHFSLSIAASIKYLSNLNEIDKSKQKLTGSSPKGFDWSKGKSSGSHGNLMASSWPLICCILALLTTHSCG